MKRKCWRYDSLCKIDSLMALRLVALSVRRPSPLNERLKDELVSRSRQDFNCWGFTSYVMGWRELAWLDERQIEEDLDRYTTVIDKAEAEPGDIVVYRWYPSYRLDPDRRIISHSAVLINPGENLMIHKPGNGRLEFAKTDGSLGYDYGQCSEITEYRRVKNEITDY